LFGTLFYNSQLYADFTLQGFFIITSLIGWHKWLEGNDGEVLPITTTQPGLLALCVVIGLVTAGIYAGLLYRFTDAYAPGWDSLLLTGSVIGQVLMMNRKLENWIFWLGVNTIAVPLFYSRGLHLTSVLYAAYWVHAVYAYVSWRRTYREQGLVSGAGAT